MTKFRIMVQCRIIRKLCVFDDKGHFDAFISLKAARTWKESHVTQNSIPSAKKIHEYSLQKKSFLKCLWCGVFKAKAQFLLC